VLLKNTVWYDYSTILHLQHAQLKFMEDHWAEAYHVNGDAIRKQITIARILTERILEDEYTDAPWRLKSSRLFDGNFTFADPKHCQHQLDQDLELLYVRMFKIKMMGWWD